jgi:hypothetical protein
MKITTSEIMQFQYILPVQGDFATLELVESINKKLEVSVNTDKEQNDSVEIKFNNAEVEFLKRHIALLDNCRQLAYSALSLIKKIKGL